MERKEFLNVKRIVIKLGTNVLRNEDGDVALSRIYSYIEDISKLVNTFGDDFNVSINVASEQLNEEFYNKLKTELDKNHLKFSNIEIEFLESESFENMDNNKNKILF